MILDRFNIKQITHQILLTPWKTYHQLCVWNLHGKLTRSWSGCAFTRVGHSLLYVIRVCQILPCGHYFGTFFGNIFGNIPWENFWEQSLGKFLGTFFGSIFWAHSLWAFWKRTFWDRKHSMLLVFNTVASLECVLWVPCYSSFTFQEKKLLTPEILRKVMS